MRTSLLVASLVLAACSSGTKSGSQAPTPPTGDTSVGNNAADAACASDADCVVVETTCCDHCNGGTALAFNKAAADAHKPAGCENTMCTQMACGQAVASCDGGTCKVTIQPMR